MCVDRCRQILAFALGICARSWKLLVGAEFDVKVDPFAVVKRGSGVCASCTLSGTAFFPMVVFALTA